jgi:hypothetical protein
VNLYSERVRRGGREHRPASIRLVDSFPDLGPLGDEELEDLLNRLVAEEREAATRDWEGSSYERRVLHGKVDIIRAELVKRRRQPESG